MTDISLGLAIAEIRAAAANAKRQGAAEERARIVAALLDPKERFFITSPSNFEGAAPLVTGEVGQREREAIAAWIEAKP